MSEGMVIGLVLLVFGLFQVARPDLMLSFESSLLKRVGGKLLVNCAKNQRIVRSIGVALTTLALLLLTQAIP